MSLENLWLKSRELLVDRGVDTGSDVLSVLEEVASAHAPVDGLTPEEADVLRSDLLLAQVVEDASAREKIVEGYVFTLEDFSTEEGRQRLKAILIDSDALPGEETLKAGERLDALAFGAGSEPLGLQVPLGELPQLGRMLSVSPVEEVATRLDLPSSEAAKLTDHAHNLFELLDLDPGQASVEIGLSEEALTRAKDVARELLSEGPIFFAEKDRASFRGELPHLGLSADVPPALEEAGLTSFTDLRRLGDPALVAEKADIALDQATLLSDHARLALITGDSVTRHRLLDAGTTGIGTIARTPLPALAQLVPDLGKEDLRQLKDRAVIVSAALRNRTADTVGQLVSAKHGYAGFGGPDELASDDLAEKLKEFLDPEDTCTTCTFCNSALNPGAYLLDLLDFLYDTFNLDLSALENRFLQHWSDLPLNCGAVEVRIRQARLAVEVMERFVLNRRSGWDRTRLYNEMANLKPQGDPLAQPDVLVRMFDDYLIELGTNRAEIKQAIAEGGQAQAALETRLKLSGPELNALNLVPDKIGISEVEKLPALLLKTKTTEQASAAIDRVEAHDVVALRDNVVRLALQAAPEYDSAQALGNYLHIDLSADACQFVTRVEQAISTIHSFVLAYRLGREPQPNAEWDERRWRWMQSYGTWQAAQMVFLYPENFILPGVRRNQTPQFREFLETVEAGDASPSTIWEAVDKYEEHVIHESNWKNVSFVAEVDNRIFLFASGAQKKVYVTEQTADGQWRGWNVLELPGTQMVGAVGFNGRLYMFFKPEDNASGVLEYAWLNPDTLKLTTGFRSPSMLKGSTSYSPSNIAFMAGSERLIVYFRGPGPSGGVTLGGAFMNRFHEWGYNPALSGAGDARLASGRPLEPVGHADGRDYLLVVDDVDLLWLVTVRDLSWDDGTVGWLQLDAAPAAAEASSWGYAGTVQDGQLVVATSWITGGDEEWEWLASVARATPGGSWTTVEIPGGVTHLVALTSAEDVLLLYSGFASESTYQAIRFNGRLVERVAKGSITFLPENWASPYPLPELEVKVDAFRQHQAQLYAHSSADDFARLILDEWYFFIPLAAARALSGAGYYQEAADWLHVVFYPYRSAAAERLIYAGFNASSGTTGTEFRDTIAWLRDPYNPYAIARARPGTFLRHTLLAYTGNLLDWADRLFSYGTSESTNRARELYQLVLALIGFDEMAADACKRELRVLEYEILRRYTAEETSQLKTILEPLYRIEKGAASLDALAEIRSVLENGLPVTEKTERVREAVAAAVVTDDLERNPRPVAEEFEERRQGTRSLDAERAAVAEETRRIGAAYGDLQGGSYIHLGEVTTMSDVLSYNFCVPANLLLAEYRLSAQSNLEKIRTCCNFAGMKRKLESYAPPVDPAGKVAEASRDTDGGEDGLVPSEPPPIYRYDYLLQRAKYFIELAQGVEQSMLMSLKEEDAAKYSLEQAKHDAQIAKGNEQLQNLRVRESEDSTTLAQLQKEKAQWQQGWYEGLLLAGLNGYEDAALFLMFGAAGFQTLAASIQYVAAAGLTSTVVGAKEALNYTIGAMQSSAAALTTTADALSTMASFERRKEEWHYQLILASKDIGIADQSILIAQDHVDITRQEQTISVLNSQFTDVAVNFLSTKFTGKELYHWMAQTLRGIYREHLNFALGTARMAQQALAFERQEAVNIIGSGSQYWNKERSGLLAAENLQLDLGKLDQHRVSTERRKRELTKTISLASVAPVEFQKLRETGVIDFDTLLEWFDRDFPGQYLRLIKNVSLTFIGLIPPVEGVHATLSNSGLSRVIVGPPFAEPKTVLREAESISVTAPNNGTGLFEVKLDDPLLLPFESSGVETSWSLELPPGANRFDFESLVDVLLTIRYTALDDWSYRKKVLERLGADSQGRISVEEQTFFSARYRFPDEWYHFTNPSFVAGDGATQPPNPYSLRFVLTPADFVPNREVQKILRLTVAAGGDTPGRVPVEVTFTPADGGATYTGVGELVDGRLALTTMQQPTPAAPQDVSLETLLPFGEWTVWVRNESTLASTYPEVFTSEEPVAGQRKLNLEWMTDLLLTIQYQAQTRYPL